MKLLYQVYLAADSDPAWGDHGLNPPVIRFRYLGGGVNAKARIYLVGDPPGPWVPLASGSSTQIHNAAVGDYYIDYQDDNVPLLNLGTFTIQPWVGSCFADLALQYTQSVSAYRFSGKVTIGIFTSPACSVSIDGGATWKPLLFSGFESTADFTDAELTLLGYTNRIPEIRIRRNNTGCIWVAEENLFIGDLIVPPFSLSETHTNETAADLDDGTATITVTGGSGNFTYLWDDGPVVKNRANLAAGTYTLTVTDVQTGQVGEIEVTITEPAQPPSTGTFLHVPFMNSVPFVNNRHLPLDDIENPQGLDNRLLCEQYFAGYSCTNYFNKICKSDVKPLQFHSDFSNFSLKLFDYRTKEEIKSIGFELKEQNIGVPDDFAITVRNHTVAGQSRVYFVVGVPPIPVEIGSTFTILNSPDGYNGNYAVVDILNDFTLGYPYLVINKAFTGPAAANNATGRFYTNATNYNVFESTLIFNDVPDGQYYYILRALDSIGGDTIYHSISEPIEVAVVHKKTNLITYRNEDNAYGITWTTGYIGVLRVESRLFKRNPGGERSTTRDADYSLVKINAKKQRLLTFETVALPPYLHEMLSVAFDTDSWTINKEEYQSNDDYAEPKYIDAYMLADSSIKVEYKHWLEGYNSDDLGTVNEGGFLIQEQGYIKL